MEFVCVSESFPSLFLLQLEVQWLNPRSVNLLLNCYWSWWKLYKKQRSLFTSSFHLIFFIVWYVSVEVAFVSRRRKKKAIFLEYLWAEATQQAIGRRLDLQRIFFLLPNNVFLYRSESLLTLPLVQRCITGSWLSGSFYVVGFYYCQKFSDVTKNPASPPEEHYLRACCWYVWETWTTLSQWKWWILQLEREKNQKRLLNVDYNTCFKTQIVILSL